MDKLVHPCGCVTEIVEDTLVLTACEKGQRCPTVKFVIAETEAFEHPYSVVDMAESRDFTDEELDRGSAADRDQT